jgi:hypothetical protein
VAAARRDGVHADTLPSRAHPPWHNHAVPVHVAVKGRERWLP